MRRKLLVAFAALFTLAGAACGAAALLAARDGDPIIAATFAAWSLFFDLIDGRVARALGATSDFGRHLDFTTDTVLAFALLMLYLDGLAEFGACMAVGLWQAAHAELDVLWCRTSGRALLWVPWIVLLIIGAA